MQNEIEMEAVKLFYKLEGTDGDADWDFLHPDIQIRWTELAKSVLAEKLRAKLEELEYCLESWEDDMGKYPIDRTWVEKERIKELQTQLSLLEGNNEKPKD